MVPKFVRSCVSSIVISELYTKDVALTHVLILLFFNMMKQTLQTTGPYHQWKKNYGRTSGNSKLLQKLGISCGEHCQELQRQPRDFSQEAYTVMQLVRRVVKNRNRYAMCSSPVLLQLKLGYQQASNLPQLVSPEPLSFLTSIFWWQHLKSNRVTIAT